jgi:hypothetical protein
MILTPLVLKNTAVVRVQKNIRIGFNANHYCVGAQLWGLLSLCRRSKKQIFETSFVFCFKN